MRIDQRLEGKRIRLVDADNDSFEGRVTDYIYPEDNDPEGKASVIMRDNKTGKSIEFFDAEIKSIEIMED